MGRYEVQKGDCLASIAASSGLAPAKIWSDPNNASLRAKRDPNVLMEGDAVFVPERTPRKEPVATGARHTFKMAGTKAALNLRLMQGDVPRKNERFELAVDGSKSSGTTDDDGWVRVSIPARATEATLSLRGGEETYSLKLGHLDPVDEVTGAKGRLRNLGYFDGAIDDGMSDEFKEALYSFQEAEGLSGTGELDEPTRSRLKGAHGS